MTYSCVIKQTWQKKSVKQVYIRKHFLQHYHSCFTDLQERQLTMIEKFMLNVEEIR